MSALPDCTCEQSIAHCARHGIQRSLTAAPTPARRKPRKPPRARSIKQEVDDAFWAGIKDAFLLLVPQCAMCGGDGGPYTLDLDHIVPRSKGGPSVASNAQLLCRGPNGCHQEKHGVPEWGRSENFRQAATEP